MTDSGIEKIMEALEKAQAKCEWQERELLVIHEAVSRLIHFFPPTHVFVQGTEADKMQAAMMDVYATCKSVNGRVPKNYNTTQESGND